MLNKQHKIRKEAAKWFARMQHAEADHPERSKFEAWLMQSDVHADEYLAISAAWDDFDSTSKANALAQAMLRKKDSAQANRWRSPPLAYLAFLVIKPGKRNQWWTWLATRQSGKLTNKR